MAIEKIVAGTPVAGKVFTQQEIDELVARAKADASRDMGASAPRTNGPVNPTVPQMAKYHGDGVCADSGNGEDITITVFGGYDLSDRSKTGDHSKDHVRYAKPMIAVEGRFRRMVITGETLKALGSPAMAKAVSKFLELYGAHVSMTASRTGGQAKGKMTRV